MGTLLRHRAASFRCPSPAPFGETCGMDSVSEPLKPLAPWPGPGEIGSVNGTGYTRERMGMLGGAFNPVHVGHLLLGREAIERLRLDRLIWIPCAQPPHKPKTELLEGSHRLAMLRLALEGDPRMEVSDLELRRDGPSFTVDTVREMAERFPGAHRFFVIGGDSLLELHTWKDLDGILEQCEIVTMARPGFPTPDPEKLKMPLVTARRLTEHIFSTRHVDVSATEIRRLAADGHSIRYLTPGPVEAYIRINRLYAGPMENTSSKHMF